MAFGERTGHIVGCGGPPLRLLQIDIALDMCLVFLAPGSVFGILLPGGGNPPYDADSHEIHHIMLVLSTVKGVIRCAGAIIFSSSWRLYTTTPNETDEGYAGYGQQLPPEGTLPLSIGVLTIGSRSFRQEYGVDRRTIMNKLHDPVSIYDRYGRRFHQHI